MHAKELNERLREAAALSIAQAVIQTIKEPRQRQLAMGQFLLGQGKLAAAELCFETVLREAKGRRTSVTVEALIGKAEIFRRRQQFEEARQALSGAHEGAKELNDPRLEGLVDWEWAEVAFAEGDHEGALERLQAAREAFAHASRPLDAAKVALRFGLLCQQTLWLSKAVIAHEEAYELAQELLRGTQTQEGVNAAGQVKFLARVGKAHALKGLGRIEEALHIAEEAEKLLSGHGPSKEEMEKLLIDLRAGCLEAQGRLAEAVRLREELVARAIDDRAKVQALVQVATLAFSIGHPEKARECEEQAVELLKRVEVPEARLGLSELNLMRGEARAAQDHFISAVVELGWPLPQRVGTPSDRPQAIAIQLHEANLELQRGLFRSALERASAVHAELINLRDEGRDVQMLMALACRLLGNIRRLEGNPEEAERLYKEALEAANRSSSALGKAAALAGLASVAATRGDAAALEDLETAINISRRCGAELQLRALELQKASLLQEKGDLTPEEAAAAMEGLLDAALRLESLPLELATRTALALLHWRESQHEPATRLLQEVMEKAALAGLDLTRIVAEGLLGLVLDDAGEQGLAKLHLGEALEAMERLGLEIEMKEQFHERLRGLTGFWF